MKNKEFIHTPIKGILPNVMLPKGVALVLEGGGIRGFYSAGVFEAFMDAQIMFPYIIGVSAGAANVISYIAGQKKRNRQVVENYVCDKQYLSKRNLLIHGSIFNMNFIFHTIPQMHIALDWEVFNKQNIRFLTGAMNCNTGQTIWFEKEHITPSLEATIASCSIPILSKIANYMDYQLLDGGISDPIPIEKSIQDGNKFHVIVLTRNKQYLKNPFRYKAILKLIYKKYPQVIDAILKRHESYNKQLALCEQLENEGKAIIIRPQKPLTVSRLSTNRAELLSLYDDGHKEGATVAKFLLSNLKELSTDTL